MDWDPFWQVIADAARPDSIEHLQALRDRLGELKWFEVVEFQVKLEEAVAAAGTADLRAAAWLVNGDASDAGFRDFRVWLVGRGKSVYERAVADPDTLADVLTGDPADGFGLDGAALRAYEEKTGMSDFPARLAAAWGHTLPPADGAGSDVSDEAELRRRFPQLGTLYPPPPEPEDEA